MSARVLVAFVLAALVLAPAGTATTPASLGTVASALAGRVAADPGAPTDGFVTFDGPVTSADLAALRLAGVHPARAWVDLGLVYVAGIGRDVVGLTALSGVVRVSGNEALSASMNTATVATNARAAWDARSTSTTPVRVGGDVVDGSGIGVAVVDSGVDATHPDLAPAVVMNKKYVCTTPVLISTVTNTCFGNFVADDLQGFDPACGDRFWIDADNTDTSSGHGTHVAGIVAGRGTQSAGRHTGAAPGATLYGLGTGEGLNVLFSVEAFSWIRCHHATVTPPIRVVTNSWGITGGSDFDAADPISILTDALVADGLVVLFAAGNDGGDGSANVISGYAKNPTRGVVSVGNYDDLDAGTRGGVMADSSSRGQATEAAGENWPDVSAPGTAIFSTRAKTGLAAHALGHPLSGGGRVLCCDNSHVEYVPDYVGVSGTSMATPHVAGIVALLLQAKPTLTPAAVEDILEDTSTVVLAAGSYVADPANPGESTNHVAGHGLVDALAALHDARVGASGGSTQPRLDAGTAVFVGGILKPQAGAHVAWKVPAGAVGFRKVAFVSGGTSVADGTGIRFVVDGGAPIQSSIVAGAANAATTLTPGLHVVEVQIDDGGAYRAFDTFPVDAV